MHLTTHAELDHTALTPSRVGAPELTEIEITPAMIEAARQRGIDLTGASSKQVNNNLIAEADLIFVMEQRHYQRIAADYPDAAGYTFLLNMRGEIDDPYGKSPETYVRCLNEVTASIDHMAQLIRSPGEK